MGEKTAETKESRLFIVPDSHVYVHEVLRGVLYLEAHTNRTQKKKKKNVTPFDGGFDIF